MLSQSLADQLAQAMSKAKPITKAKTTKDNAHQSDIDAANRLAWDTFDTPKEK